MKHTLLILLCLPVFIYSVHAQHDGTILPAIHRAIKHTQYARFQEAESSFSAILAHLSGHRHGIATPAQLASLQVECLAGMADLKITIGKYAEARGCLERASTIIREKLQGRDYLATAHLCDSWGEYHFQADNNLGRALLYYQKALAIKYRLLPADDPDILKSRVLMGIVYYWETDTAWKGDRIQKLAEDNIRIYERKGITEDLYYGQSLRLLGLRYVFFRRNNSDVAKGGEYFKKVLAMYRKMYGENNHYTAYAYHNMGNWWDINCGIDSTIAPQIRKIGGIPFHRKALQLREKVLGSHHPYVMVSAHLIGQTFKELKQYDSCLVYCRKAFAAVLPGFTLHSFDDEIPVREIAYPRYMLYTIDTYLGIYDRLSRTYPHKAHHYKDKFQNLLTTKLAYIQQIEAKATDDLQWLNLPGLYSGTCAHGAYLCAELYEKNHEMKWLEKAFWYMRYSKSHLMQLQIEKKKRTDVLLQNEQLFALNEEINAVRRKVVYLEEHHLIDSLKYIAFLGEKLLQRKEKKAKLEKAKEVHLQDITSEAPQTVLKQLREKLGTQTALVEYQYLIPDSQKPKDGMLVFYVDSDTMYLQKLLSDDELFAACFDSLTQSIVTRNDRNYFYYGHKVYRELWKVFEKNLKGRKVIVIPDADMAAVPFHALLTENIVPSPAVRYATLPYLMKKHHISRHYSSDLYLKSNTQPDNRKLEVLALAPFSTQKSLEDELERQKHEDDRLAFDDLKLDSMRSTSLRMLQSSVRELSGIMRFAGGQYLTEDNASKKAFKQSARQYGILHFVTHSQAEVADNKEEYFLYLSNGKGDYEKLHDYEIAARDFSGTDLVVLSSCESAAGKIKAGEGMVSIAYNFLYSGAESVVASLWNLSDKTTASIMPIFYRNLGQGLPKAEALQQSQIEYLGAAHIPDQYKHPFYWAALIFQGHNRAISLKSPDNSSWWWISSATLLSAIMASTWFYLHRRNKTRYNF